MPSGGETTANHLSVVTERETTLLFGLGVKATLGKCLTEFNLLYYTLNHGNRKRPSSLLLNQPYVYTR